MPTVRELVLAIRQRPGIEAAIVLGQDGLVIAADADPQIDTDDLAARVPVFLAAADALASGSPLITAVLEQEQGSAIVATLRADAVLLVLAGPRAELAPLVYDIRRHRDRIAALV